MVLRVGDDPARTFHRQTEFDSPNAVVTLSNVDADYFRFTVTVTAAATSSMLQVRPQAG